MHIKIYVPASQLKARCTLSFTALACLLCRLHIYARKLDCLLMNAASWIQLVNIDDTRAVRDSAGARRHADLDQLDSPAFQAYVSSIHQKRSRAGMVRVLNRVSIPLFTSIGWRLIHLVAFLPLVFLLLLAYARRRQLGHQR